METRRLKHEKLVGDKPADKVSEDTRERLIKAARLTFANKGFSGTTIKDLADEAGVNVSLVSYHFGGKEGLYRAVLEEFGKGGLAVVERLLQTPRSAEEFIVKLRIFADEVFNFHLSNTDSLRILHRDCDLEEVKAIANDIFGGTFVKVGEALQHFFETAQKNGVVRSDLDARMMSSLFFGSVIHCAAKDHVTEKFSGFTIKDPVYREKLLDHIMSYCSNGCIQPRENG